MNKYPRVSKLTDIENQFLDLTQEIIEEGQAKLEHQNALRSMGRGSPDDIMAVLRSLEAEDNVK